MFFFPKLYTAAKIIHCFSNKKIEIFIDHKAFQVDSQLSIYQAAKCNGIQIPRFCYHERLKIAGNCRMCLVEVQKSPKAVASCCSQVSPGMKIHTKSEMVRTARGGVMEFLLTNHPLDCPICDQGGECDLQSNSSFYGYNTGRYSEFKRAVEDKNIGPLISTHMSRCIHCTRCIRFAEEVAGFYDLGTTGRAKSTQIHTYVQKLLTSQLSGNLADICPVGALNNGPFAFTARPYELLTKNSIDLMDSMGSHITIDHKENVLMRVNPKVNQQINQQWLSDKSRQSFDGLKRQRLIAPLLRNGVDFAEEHWEVVMRVIANKINAVNGNQIACGIGQFESIENIQALKDFLNSLNCFQYEFRKDHLRAQSHFRADYLFNTQIEPIQHADLILLIGVNPRTETPLLNSRIMKVVNHKKTNIFSIGVPADLTYQYTHLGTNASILTEIFQNKNKVCQSLSKSQRPMMIIGRDALSRADGQQILQMCKSIALKYNFVNTENGWNGFNILHRSQGEINALELGMQFKSPEVTPKVIFLLGCDNYFNAKDIPKGSFVIYIGSHGDQGAQYADAILPACSFTEKYGTYVNLEGRVQMANKIVEAPGMSRESWEIIRALSEECGCSLPYNSLAELRHRIYELSPHLLGYDRIQHTVFGKVACFPSKQSQSSIAQTAFSDLIDNYYITDSITRNSVTMAKCSVAFNTSKHTNFKKIHSHY